MCLLCCGSAQYNKGMTHTTTPTTDPVVTKSMLEENNKLLTEQLTESISTKIINEVSELFRDFGERVDDRFNKIEADIRELTSRVDGLEEKYDHIIRTLDTFLKRLADSEENDLARDAQLARFERWLHQLADKANVKLET